MTIKKAMRLLTIAAAVAYCVIVAASYRQHITWDVEPTDRAWGQIVFQNGNMCLVTVLAGSDGKEPYAGMLDDYKLFWRRHIATSYYSYWHFEKTHDVTGATIHEFRLSISAIAVFVLFLGLLVARSRWKAWGLSWYGLAREILRPSYHSSPLGRFFRRSFVAVMFLGFLVAAMGLAVSRSRQTRGLTSTPFELNMGTHRFSLFFKETMAAITKQGVTLDVQCRPLTAELKDGSLRLDHCVPSTATPSSQDANFSFGGVVYQHNYPVEFPLGWSPTVGPNGIWAKPPGIINNHSRELRLPLWLVMLLLLGYPIVALLRGPVKRCRMRNTGRCTQCGYDLTGLTRPRCPECGSPFPGASGLEDDPCDPEPLILSQDAVATADQDTAEPG